MKEEAESEGRREAIYIYIFESRKKSQEFIVGKEGRGH